MGSANPSVIPYKGYLRSFAGCVKVFYWRLIIERPYTGSSSSYCEREKICITRSFWEELRDKMNEYLDSVTLQDLAERAKTVLPEEPMYFI